MKFILMLFILSMPLQPMQLQACDMESQQETSHHDSSHSEEPGDCCEPDPEETSHSCGVIMQCGSCVPVLTSILTSVGSADHNRNGQYHDFNEHHLSAAHQYPLLRPPIS